MNENPTQPPAEQCQPEPSHKTNLDNLTSKQKLALTPNRAGRRMAAKLQKKVGGR